MTCGGPLRSEKALREAQISLQELAEFWIRTVRGLDIHRQRLTFDWVDDTGGAKRGRIARADRVGFRKWPGRFDGEVELGGDGARRVAVGAIRGWVQGPV